MKKLTDKVKQAIDDKKLSESAAAREMATMTAENVNIAEDLFCLTKKEVWSDKSFKADFF